MIHQKIIKKDVKLIPDTRLLEYDGVFVKGGFDCSNTRIGSLRGSPGKVQGFFYCHNTAITSLNGAPSYVGGAFNCADTSVSSFEGAPSYVGRYFGCRKTAITSLHNIHKHIKHIGEELYLPSGIRSHILGVMKINGLKEINFEGPYDAGQSLFNLEISPRREDAFKLEQVKAIINKHLQGDRDIHDCQEELLEAGLVEYARL